MDSFSFLFWTALAVGAYAFSQSFRKSVNNKIISLADSLRNTTSQNTAHSVSDQTQRPWLRNFALYHIAVCLHHYRTATDPIPYELSGIITDTEDYGVCSRILYNSLALYLEREYHIAASRSDFQSAYAKTKEVLETELRIVFSPSSLRRYVRAMSKEGNGVELDEEGLSTQYDKLQGKIANDPALAEAIKADVLLHNVGKMFESSHGISFERFVSNISKLD